jgi:SWI/SNF-related matrix-associated actin-dependent regulator 1 of chromatin subfamily A
MDILKRLEEEPEFVAGCLLALHQAGEFDPMDGRVLVGFCRQYRRRRWLSPKQISLARARLRRYQGLLQELDPSPAPFIRKRKRSGAAQYSRPTIRQFHPVPTSDQVPDQDLQELLYRFQRVGVNFLESRGGRALLADEPGLGKTLQALGWLKLHPEVRPTIVICPASVKWHWAREIDRIMPERGPAVVLEERTPFGPPPSTPPLGGTQLIVINYDILDGWKDWLKALAPKAVIIDEVHKIKNPDAKRTRACLDLCSGVFHVIGLSGTPIRSRPHEFWEIIHLLEPGLFSFWEYVREFCDAKQGYKGTWDFTGSSNPKKLNQILSRTIMLRRRKVEVLPDLPKKRRVVVPLDWDRRSYNRVAAEFDRWLDSLQDGSGDRVPEGALLRVGKLKHAIAAAKIGMAASWIDDFLESGEKLIVFAYHRDILQALLERTMGWGTVLLDGSTSGQDRKKMIDAFQNHDEVRLFLGQIEAAGEGINLTAASTVAFVEFGWTPGEHDQAEDRPHRIGQEAESVLAYYLVAGGSIENEIVELLDRKRQVVTEILDGREAQDFELVGELLQRLIDRKRKGLFG